MRDPSTPCSVIASGAGRRVTTRVTSAGPLVYGASRVPINRTCTEPLVCQSIQRVRSISCANQYNAYGVSQVPINSMYEAICVLIHATYLYPLGCQSIKNILPDRVGLGPCRNAPGRAWTALAEPGSERARQGLDAFRKNRSENGLAECCSRERARIIWQGGGGPSGVRAEI